jgi:hypothetical protein
MQQGMSFQFYVPAPATAQPAVATAYPMSQQQSGYPQQQQQQQSGYPQQQQQQQQQQQHQHQPVQMLPLVSWTQFQPHLYQPVALGMHNALPQQIHQPEPRPTGRRKALLIGINYTGTRAALRGCVNDVRNMKDMLAQHGFHDRPDSMVCLTDDQRGQFSPTKANIMKGLQWLVAGAVAGDSLFFHFSGHGAQKRDPTGHESDGMNETVLPVDFQRAGQITDDEIWNTIVWPLQSGVRLTAVMDCCHSGTGMDLPFLWKYGSWEEEVNPAHSAGDVQLFSGCEDAQCSADTYSASVGAGGAMTQAFIAALKSNPMALYPDFLETIHRHLRRRGMRQKPMLTSSQRFDLSSRVFTFTDGFIPNQNPQLGRILRKRVHPPRPGFQGFEGSDTNAMLVGAAVGIAGLAVFSEMMR